MLIRDGTLPDGRHVDIRISDGRIQAIGSHLAGEPTIDASGLLILPGAVDVHVHLRQPGGAHKETWASGTKAAAAGGVTTVVDQPNTDPPTVDRSSFRAKAAIAERDAIVDYGINGGVTPSWKPDELLEEPISALGEVFMADSTGELGIEASLFETALRLAGERDLLVTVHAEDATKFDSEARRRDDAVAWSDYRTPEAEIAATEQAASVAEAVDARWHLAHASTPEAIDRAIEAGATCEVTPHHLLLSTDDLDTLGTYGRMNPPLRSEARRKAVYERVLDGSVSMIATDHAPHTITEKEQDIWSAPSGVPGVETMVPLLLAEARDGPLTYDRVARLCATNPASRFGFERKGRLKVGYDADLVLVDVDRTRSIDPDELYTACGWSPFAGATAVFPSLVLLRGHVAYRDPSADLEVPPALSTDTFGPARGRNVREMADHSSSAESSKQ